MASQQAFDQALPPREWYNIGINEDIYPTATDLCSAASAFRFSDAAHNL
jgi:hypothetical protein